MKNRYIGILLLVFVIGIWLLVFDYWYLVIGIWATFEADPIGRRLECLPKKGININFTLFLKVFLMGPRGAQGLIKMPPGAPELKQK